MKKAIAVLLAVVQFTGCSFFVGNRQNVTVTTNVETAQIFANGELVGTGMVSFKAPRNQDMQLMAKAEGYQTAFHHIDTKLSTAGILDVVGLFVWIIPIFGLFSAGSKQLDETNVALNLATAN